MPPWVRLIAGFVFEVVSAAVVVGVPGVWLAGHMDLAHLAASRASAAVGRDVTVGSLRVGFGRTLTIALANVVVPNIGGGSAPEMLTLKHLTAELDARSLLHGPVLLHHVAVNGLSVLLERIADGTRNWRFEPPGSPARKPPADPTGRTGFPSLRDVAITGSQVVFHTGGGKNLVTALDDARISTPGDDQPVKLTIAGGYNGTPLQLDADLQSIDRLRDAATPFGTVLAITSGEVALVFDGTMTDPLNFNGLDGTLRLDAPDPKPIFAIAGAAKGLDTALHLDGPFEHTEPSWTWRDAQGQLGHDEVKKATLAFVEGARGKPDRVDIDLAFATLDLNELLGSGAKGKRSGADMSLEADRSPDTLVHARVTAGTLEYSEIRANDVTLAGSQTEGRVAVDMFSLNTFGTQVKASGQIEAVPTGARVTAAVSAAGADIQTLRRNLGFGTVPVTGRLDAEVAVESTARTMNAAVRGARVSAVMAIRGGSVEKSIIEMASTNVLALLRTNKGLTPVTCLLAGLDMRGGIGTLAPLRLRSADGTIAGSARFDLYRKTFDMTIGSEAKTTGLFALDIPIRASGSFSAPTVQPAKWSPEGRALLARADSMSQLPPALRDWARRNPCPPTR